MTIRKVLAGVALLSVAAPGFAQAPVRFEPAVMTPAAQAQYVDVARKQHRHHHRRHHKSAAHYNRHAQVITGASIVRS